MYKRIQIAGAVLLLSGAVMAAFVWNVSTVSVPETSPGAAAFTTTFYINTSVPPAPNAFSDVILAVEEGRDDRGPFCAMIVTHGPGSPYWPGTSANHPCMPGVTAPGSYFPWANIATVDCSIQPQGTPTTRRYIYRPTNDPANPGWGSVGGAAAGQIESGVVACHMVAEAIRLYIADVAAGGFAGVPGLPTIMIEVDWNPAANPQLGWTDLEFYKFKIQTIGNP